MNNPVPQKINDLIENGYQFRLGDYISEGFELFKKNAGQFVLFTLVFFAISLVASMIPIIGSLSGFIIGPPLLAGFYMVARSVQQNKATEFGDFFKGFDNIGPLILVGLIGGIITIIGYVCLIIPGVYLAIAYSFGTLFVVFYKLDFWEALETSRKVITKNWFSLFGFAIVLALINIVGALVLLVGLLVTVPITLCATYIAFADVTKLEEESDDIIEHLVA